MVGALLAAPKSRRFGCGKQRPYKIIFGFMTTLN